MSLAPEEARTLLLARLEALRRENELAAGSIDPVVLDQESVGRLSRIDAMQMQAMAMASQRRRVAERAQIDAALRRIEEGEYGWCIGCGDDIAEARLRHNPAVAKCIDCAD